MRADVWYEEVDRALIKYIKSNILVIDRKTKKYVPLNVIVRNPQGDAQIQNPCATIYHYGEYQDKFRYEWQNQVVSKDLEKGVATISESAKPYNMLVQIDFWSDYQKEINDMTKQWCSSFDYQGYLEVVDSSGETRYCTVNKKGFNKQDYNDTGERQFQRTYNYEIWVELDSGKSTDINIMSKPFKPSLKD